MSAAGRAPAARVAWREVARTGVNVSYAIFTIAHGLQALWWGNARLLIEILFRSARDTLMALLRDPRHLGTTPGVLISLHTWAGRFRFIPTCTAW